jgi:hypothetical protein
VPRHSAFGLIKKTVSYTFTRAANSTRSTVLCMQQQLRPTFASSLIHSFIPALVRFASAAAFCNSIKTPAARAFCTLAAGSGQFGWARRNFFSRRSRPDFKATSRSFQTHTQAHRNEFEAW